MKRKHISLSGAQTHESRIYFRAEIQKYFGSFLVQIKTLKFASEKYWPLHATKNLDAVDNIPAPWWLIFFIQLKDYFFSDPVSSSFTTQNLFDLKNKQSLIKLSYIFWLLTLIQISSKTTHGFSKNPVDIETK